MNRLLYLASTALFWIVVAWLWLGDDADRPAPASSARVAYTLAEIAQHDRREDCWMAIRGQVYDFTAYLPDHPTRPQVLLPSCGTDATRAYETKNVGRAHTPYADTLLEKYRLGPLSP
jgi:cytochrome b involved in lipid metabolism